MRQRRSEPASRVPPRLSLSKQCSTAQGMGNTFEMLRLPCGAETVCGTVMLMAIYYSEYGVPQHEKFTTKASFA
eukprot:5218077-Prymnesium_polylepis.1